MMAFLTYAPDRLKSIEAHRETPHGASTARMPLAIAMNRAN